VELALLGFLRQRPMHGYELHQLLADPDGLDGLWQIKLGRLYAMLGRLEADGYLVARTEPQGDRPPRKVFSLTAEGERAFLAWLETPVAQPRSLRLAFLLKLYFARREPPGTAARLIAAQQAGCEEWLVGPLVAGPATTPHQAAVRRFRLGQIEAIHNWLTWLAAAVEAGR
jgi:DNA-binding PadR family transcriptional regulator